jgi:hypothetical protein
LDQLRNNVSYWQRMVTIYENRAAGGAGNGFSVGTFR